MQIMINFVNEEGSVIMPENRLYYLTASLDKCARRHEEGKLPPPYRACHFVVNHSFVEYKRGKSGRGCSRCDM